MSLHTRQMSRANKSSTHNCVNNKFCDIFETVHKLLRWTRVFFYLIRSLRSLKNPVSNDSRVTGICGMVRKFSTGGSNWWFRDVGLEGKLYRDTDAWECFNQAGTFMTTSYRLRNVKVCAHNAYTFSADLDLFHGIISISVSGWWHSSLNTALSY